MTVPCAGCVGSALRFRMSASRSTFSSSCGMPWPVLVDMCWHWYVPPRSSTVMPRSASCPLMRSGFALGLSILLMAMMMGVLAICACVMASFVCGMTCSSAAMMMMTMSVICAPRARMAVKAWCPGVSRKMIRFCCGVMTS